MLESSRLLVGPRRPAGEASVRSREVRDRETGERLGAVREAPRPAWLRWLPGPVLEVREAGDEPLLFTVRRTWVAVPTWEVLDAEGRCVGYFRASEVADPFGQTLAAWAAEGVGPGGRWVTPQGQELLRVSPGWAEETVILFDPRLDGNPLGKMVLLAATLGREQGP